MKSFKWYTLFLITIFLLMSIISPMDVYATDSNRAKCEMTIISSLHTPQSPASASSPCGDVVQGYYVKELNKFGISGMATYTVRYSGQQFEIAIPDDTYSTAVLTVYTVVQENPPPEPAPEPEPTEPPEEEAEPEEPVDSNPSPEDQDSTPDDTESEKEEDTSEESTEEELDEEEEETEETTEDSIQEDDQDMESIKDLNPISIELASGSQQNKGTSKNIEKESDKKIASTVTAGKSITLPVYLFFIALIIIGGISIVFMLRSRVRG